MDFFPSRKMDMDGWMDVGVWMDIIALFFPQTMEMSPSFEATSIEAQIPKAAI